jgi:hypothetical protein
MYKQKCVENFACFLSTRKSLINSLSKCIAFTKIQTEPLTSFNEFILKRRRRLIFEIHGSFLPTIIES